MRKLPLHVEAEGAIPPAAVIKIRENLDGEQGIRLLDSGPGSLNESGPTLASVL